MKAERLDVGGGANAVANAHGLHRAMRGSLVEREEFDRHLRDALGHRQHRLVEIVDRERPVGHSRGNGVGSTHRIAGQQRFHPATQSHQPGLPLHVRRRHQPHGRVSDLRVLGDVHEVAGRGEFGAAGETPAVHLTDDRRGHVPHLQPVVDDVAAPPPVGLGDATLDVVVGCAEVVTGAERRAVPTDDDHRNVAVVVG